MTQTIDFNGLPAVRMVAPDRSEATILLQGAHLVSWKPRGGPDRLYLSEKAVYTSGKAVRGGIPVCFPQFSDRGPLPAHGFARVMDWAVEDVRSGEDHATAVFVLTDSEASRAMWPHRFRAELSVSVSGERLDVELEVENPGDAPFTFTTALHTYLAVKEVEEVTLEGLRGLRYWSKVSNETKTDTGVGLSISEEVDRVYFDTTRPLLLRESGRSLGIHSENMPDTVVWNPWEERIKQFADLPGNGFRRFLCVEAGAIDKPVTLAPAQSWWGRQTLVAM